MLFQNYIPVKNCDISPRLTKVKFFLSKTIGKGVAMQGANKKTWQNMAQSYIHQQVCIPHSYDDNNEVKYEEVLYSGGFTIFKSLSSNAFHKI